MMKYFVFVKGIVHMEKHYFIWKSIVSVENEREQML